MCKEDFMFIKEKDPIVFLVKFVRPKFASDFMNGNLYFDSLEHIHEIEQTTGISKWGDINDGKRKHKLNNNDRKAQVTISPSPNKHIIFPDKYFSDVSLTLSMSEDNYKSYGITCFVALRLSDFYPISDHSYKLKIMTYNDLIKMQEGIRKVFLIPDIGSFEHQLKTTNLKFSSVHYYDIRLLSPEKFRRLNNNPMELPFHKENKFAYQREYRILKSLKDGSKMTLPFLKTSIKETSMLYLKRYTFTFTNLYVTNDEL